MSDTPRTDAALAATQGMFRAAAAANGFLDLARQHEREINALTIGKCTCNCGKPIPNGWRDSDGYHCLTCLAKQRNEAREVLDELRVIVSDLAEWDAKWKKGTIYPSTLQKECEGKLDSICDRAAAFYKRQTAPEQPRTEEWPFG